MKATEIQDVVAFGLVWQQQQFVNAVRWESGWIALNNDDKIEMKEVSEWMWDWERIYTYFVTQLTLNCELIVLH
jgi:hypothetical protein